jgi:LPS-assembly lipoprotein
MMPVAVISKSGHSPLERLLESRLRLHDVAVTDDPAIAKYWIVILNEYLRQDIAAVAASTAPRQYQLTLKVVFQIQKAKGKTKLPPEPIKVSVNRLLTINNDRILGSDSEAAILKQEMEADVATQILAKLENSLYIDK